jgi:ketol-acid reductoisomerase
MDEPRFVQESEADLQVLSGKRIAIIGYGNLGRPLALNLRDSGINPLIVAEAPGPAWDLALADGFRVESALDAASEADVVLPLLPDETMPDIYRDHLAPALSSGKAVVFASGYNLAIRRIVPGPDLDVLLLAPRMIGVGIRECYQRGLGFPSFVSVEQDATGQAWPVLCALAKAMGSLRSGAMVLSAEQETHLDLFVEQTVGPDLAAAILTAFQVGMEEGLPAEALALELYMSGEVGRTIEAMAEFGFFEQVKLHGFTAAYGGMVRFMALDRDSQARGYSQVMKEIKDGTFAARLREEVDSGFPTQGLLDGMLGSDNPVSLAEDRVRRAMRLPKTGGPD